MYDMCSAQRVKFEAKARDAKLTEGTKVRRERGRGGEGRRTFHRSAARETEIATGFQEAMITYRSRMFDPDLTWD